MLLLALLLASAVIFEKRIGVAIVNRSVAALNDYLRVPVTVSGAEFTFFDNFPHASIHLRNVVVCSAYPEIFGGDTLLAARSVFLVFNPLKLLAGDYSINACKVARGYLSLRTSPRGEHNYDIFDPSRQSDTAAVDLRLSVDRFQLSDMACVYSSAKSRLTVDFFVTELMAKLQLFGAKQRLALQFDGLVNLLKQNEFVYVHRQQLGIEAALLRDSTIYSMQRATLAFGRSRLGITGQYDTKSMNFSLLAESSSLNLLSVLAFTSQYKWKLPPELDLRGSVNTTIALDGSLGSTKTLGISLTVHGEGLKCKYRDKGFTIDRIVGEFSNGEKHSLASSALNISACDISSSNSAAHVQFYLTNLQRPSVYAKWDIVLQNSEFLPAQWARYDPRYLSLHSQGEYVATFPAIDSMSLGRAILPKMRLEADINGVAVRLSPDLRFTDVSGALTVVDGDISKGSLKGQANGQQIEVSFSASDFLRQGGRHARWTINAAFDAFDFDRGLPLAAANADTARAGGERFRLWDYAATIDGEVTVARSTWRRSRLDSVSMRFSARDGEVRGWIANASFMGGNTRGWATLSRQPDSSSFLTADLYQQRLDLPLLFEGFNNFGQPTLRSENLAGRLSGKLSLQMPLRGGGVDFTAIQAQAFLTVTDGALVNVKPLEYLSRFIALDELMNLRFATLQNTITVRNGRVSIPSMKINSSALGLTVSGDHHFNGRYLYRVRVGLGDILFNRLRVKKQHIEENSFEDAEDESKVWLFLMIEGDSTSAYVRYDKEALGEHIREHVEAEKASLREVWEDTYGAPENTGDDPVKKRQTHTTPILWQDDSTAAIRLKRADTIRKKIQPQTPARPSTPVIWGE